MECSVRAISNAQRAGILERQTHNKKHSAVVLYTNKRAEQEAFEFASVLQEAGWTVSGPQVDENICAEGLRVGVRDLNSTSPSAHLLLDVLLSGGLNTSLVKAAEVLPSAFSSGCCLLLGRSRTGPPPGR